MTARKKDLLLATGLALGAWLIYLSALSKSYVFEGLMRALPIETGRWVHLFAGNYLLYGPIGLIFHTTLRAAGFSHLAVMSLQMLDATLGAAGLFIFYRLLRRLGGDALISTAWTVVMGFSLGYWMWSTDAENYMLSTVLLMTAFYFLVKNARGEKVDPVLLGALHGLAILGHIVNIIFGAVVLWFLFCGYGKKWKQPALRYVSAAALVSLCAYGAVLTFVQKPPDWQTAWTWFKGSAVGPDALTHFGGGWSFAKGVEWVKMTAHIFVSFQPGYSHPPAWPIASGCLTAACLLLLFLAGVLLVRIRTLLQTDRAIAGGCLVWLGVYACVFTRWQPWTMVYRVSDLVPLCVLLFLGVQRGLVPRALGRRASWVLAACLGLGNAGAEIVPRSFATNNPHLMRMQFFQDHTREGDWITGDGGQDEIYIPYFARRRPIVIERYADHPEVLDALLQRLIAAGQSIFVSSRVLDNPRWTAFFHRYTLKLIQRDANGYALYRMKT